MTRPASRRKAQPVPTPLTRTCGPFNATNNALDDYETNCTDYWRYIKTPLQSGRCYLKETLTPRRLEPKARYIKPSTLPWKGTKNINLKKRETIEHSWLFHIYSIILFWLWHRRCCDTPVIIPNRRSSLDHTGIWAGVWIHLGTHHSTDEVTLHQFGIICGDAFCIEIQRSSSHQPLYSKWSPTKILQP